MASFKAVQFTPKPGQQITGQSGHHQIQGEYLRTRSVGRCVLAYVKTSDGREIGINEIAPVESVPEASVYLDKSPDNMVAFM